MVPMLYCRQRMEPPKGAVLRRRKLKELLPFSCARAQCRNEPMTDYAILLAETIGAGIVIVLICVLAWRMIRRPPP